MLRTGVLISALVLATGCSTPPTGRTDAGAGSDAGAGAGSDAGGGPDAGALSALAAGDDFTCAVVAGEVWCWGTNCCGQLGISPPATSLVPVKVQGIPPPVSGLTGGDAHACAIAAGQVYCWGWNNLFQLGSTSTASCAGLSGLPCSATPVRVAGLPAGATQVVAGFTHSCALVNGTVWCWGNNSVGQIGTPGLRSDAGLFVADPVLVPGLPGPATALAARATHTCALVDGGVWCWGSDSATSSTTQPAPISGLGSGVTLLAVGVEHGCALVNGVLECWGGTIRG